MVSIMDQQATANAPASDTRMHRIVSNSGLKGSRCLRAVPILTLAAALLGCQATGPEDVPGAAAPSRPADPVAAFAARATPGAEDQVLIPETGQIARLRLVRAYYAASGRECREVLLRTAGGAEGSRLLCNDGRAWVDSRPLIGRAPARS